MSWQAKRSVIGPRRKVVRWTEVRQPLSRWERMERSGNPQQDRGWGTAILSCGHHVSGPYTGSRYATPCRSKKCPKCAEEGKWT